MSCCGVTVAAVASAGVIVVASAGPPPLAGTQGPPIALSASEGPLADVSVVLSGLIGSGPPSLEALLDLASDPSSLTSLLTTLANIEIAVGVGLSGLAATPFSLLSGAVTSLGAAIAELGGVFTSIGTAVAAGSALPAGIAELIETAGAAVTQGLVTPIYDFLIKLVSGAASTLSAQTLVGLVDSPDGLPELTPSLDPGAALDFNHLVPDLLAAF